MEHSSSRFIPRVFVSYASADREFALTLANRLQSSLGTQGSVIFSRSGGPDSDSWFQHLESELSAANVYVLILSPAAFASSWTQQEISTAIRQAVSLRNKVIIPVMYQMTEMPPFLAQYQTIGFVDRPFDRAFADLVHAVSLGSSRRIEVEAGRFLRVAPPYDYELLPIPAQFVGRQLEVAEINDYLSNEQATIVQIVGVPGIGKSALAGLVVRMVYATNRFPDGIGVFSCSLLRDPFDLLRLTLRRFDPDLPNTEGATPRELIDLMSSHFTGKQALLVYDDVPQQLNVGEAVHAIRNLGISILLTARSRIPNLPDGYVVSLGEMSEEEGLRVLFDALGDHDSFEGRQVEDATRVAALRIIQTLGYIPLAIQLMGRYATGRDLREVADQLSADPLLPYSKDDARISVRYAIERILSRASAEAVRLFTCLGALPSTECGRNATSAFLPTQSLPNREVYLSELVRLALVETYVNADMVETSDRVRVRLHPLVKAFASHSFEEASRSEQELIRGSIADWYTSYVGLAAGPTLVWDEENIFTALRWALENGWGRQAAALGRGLRSTWRYSTNVGGEATLRPETLESALQSFSGQSDSRARMIYLDLLVLQGDLFRLRGPLRRARVVYTEALALARELDDGHKVGNILSSLGRVELQMNQLDTAESLFHQCLDLRRKLADKKGETVCLFHLGEVALRKADLQSAMSAFAQTLSIAEGM